MALAVHLVQIKTHERTPDDSVGVNHQLDRAAPLDS